MALIMAGTGPQAQEGTDRTPPLAFARQARAQNPGVWIDIEKPFWWDAPVWAASGLVNSVGLANNHMCRDQMFADEAWGRARDRTRLPVPNVVEVFKLERHLPTLRCINPKVEMARCAIRRIALEVVKQVDQNRPIRGELVPQR